MLHVPEIDRAALAGEGPRLRRAYSRPLILLACVAVRDGTPTSDQLALALRAHVRERLGGLAHPRTIAFLEEFPEDLPRADLRRILRLLCATAASENISLTLEQLRAAARASRRA